ncbi:MAG TPA: DNA-processing protein DprA [Candidatus Krumholzibacteria bacterium]|nr:DNA-processing protein DprA [Candidatus Krumholzibacteria bacterium]
MDTLRAALAVLCTEHVWPSDWVHIAAQDAARVLDDLETGGRVLSDLLGRRLGPTDWARVDAQLERVREIGAGGITLWDDAYPVRLRETPFAPPLLFVRGRAEWLRTPAIAIVGTRTPSAPGSALARRLAAALAGSDIAVVSGLARGIDTAAHEGALGAAGVTLAVLGTGVDVAYPPENAGLLARVAATGCVVSEQLCGTRATRYVFPRRNRIISGLCEAVVVVEGGPKSGALITARWALDQGREVGAVPGFPGDFRSAGPNRLLRDGAFLVEDGVDVLMNVPALRAIAGRVPDSVVPATPHGDVPAVEARVLDLAGPGITPDELALVAGMEPERALEVLSRLEIAGHIVRDGLGRFVRKPD